MQITYTHLLVTLVVAILIPIAMGIITMIKRKK